ncbi:hypothetical protein [Vibrio splendidus]|uniref:hypothetical protein n=1 Tax=Vibrio splendidus TaxID=29497 RepID=UPI00246903B5|nr:hypothetical protein [Vibrio splendidus]MDH6025261.1 hypothetical protein [Vibrio splendidus]
MTHEHLDDAPSDFLVSLAKGTVGIIPGVGGLVAEVIGSTIPNQRIDRISGFVKELDKRIDELEYKLIKDNQFYRDIFEDAIQQASRSLSSERNKYLAQFIKNTLNLPLEHYAIQKKLLFTLQELTDLDIEFLVAVRDFGFYEASKPFKLGTPTLEELNDPKRELLTVSLGMHVLTLERLDLVKLGRVPDDSEYLDSNIDANTGLAEITECRVSKIGEHLLKAIQI